MVIETPNWNRDKFGETQPAGRISSEIRANISEMTPIIGETLGGYNRRIASIIKRYEDISADAHTGRAGRKMWFTHRTPSECWICQQINVNWMVSDVLDIVNRAFDGEKWVFKDHKGTMVLVKGNNT